MMGEDDMSFLRTHGGDADWGSGLLEGPGANRSRVERKEKSRSLSPFSKRALITAKTGGTASHIDRGVRGDGHKAKRFYDNEKLPPLYSVHKGVVRAIRPFGAFVQMDGYRRQGLVHISQLTKYKTEKVEDVVSEGDEVWVKVIAIAEDEDGTRKLSLSMKHVNQSSGLDMDENNVAASSEGGRRTSRTQAQQPLDLEQILLTTRCTRCGGPGHIAIQCFGNKDEKYEEVADTEGDAAATGAQSVSAASLQNIPSSGSVAAKRQRSRSPSCNRSSSPMVLSQARRLLEKARMKEQKKREKKEKKERLKKEKKKKKTKSSKDRERKKSKTSHLECDVSGLFRTSSPPATAADAAHAAQHRPSPSARRSRSRSPPKSRSRTLSVSSHVAHRLRSRSRSLSPVRYRSPRQRASQHRSP